MKFSITDYQSHQHQYFVGICDEPDDPDNVKVMKCEGDCLESGTTCTDDMTQEISFIIPPTAYTNEQTLDDESMGEISNILFVYGYVDTYSHFLNHHSAPVMNSQPGTAQVKLETSTGKPFFEKFCHYQGAGTFLIFF